MIANIKLFCRIAFVFALWSPVLDPHMVGGALFPGAVTVKVSVRHWEREATGAPAAERGEMNGFAKQLVHLP